MYHTIYTTVIFYLYKSKYNHITSEPYDLCFASLSTTSLLFNTVRTHFYIYLYIYIIYTIFVVMSNSYKNMDTSKTFFSFFRLPFFLQKI